MATELNQLTIADLVEEEVKEELAKKPLALSVLASDLKEALTRISAAVSRRSTLPILSNVLLELDQEHGLLRLSATNLEYAISTRIEAEIESVGIDRAITLPFADLLSEVAGTPKKDKACHLHFQGSPESSTIVLTNGNGTRTLTSMPASEYPTIPFTHGEEAPTPLVFQADQLKQAIALTTFAAAQDESRPVFTGVSIQPEQNQAQQTFIAADAFRMAVYEYKGLASASPLGMLVPAVTLNVLAKLLPTRTTDILVSHIDEKHQVVVLIPDTDTLLVSRTIDGLFPNFRTIIPKECEAQVEVVLKPLAQAVRSLVLISKLASNILHLEVVSCGHPDCSNEYEDKLCLKLWATNKVSGEKTITLGGSDIHYALTMLEQAEREKRGYKPECFLSACFNASYLRDVLDRLERQGVCEVTLHLQQQKPTKIVPVGYLESCYQAIVMPMHVNR